MDIFLLLIGFFITLLGIAGAFLPVLPGPITSWVGLLLLYLTSAVPMDYNFLGITLVVALIITIIDYIIPAIGTKKFGGSSYGVTGSMIGLVLGIFWFPPVGIILGPFLGAFIGELLNDAKKPTIALKAAFGSFIGFLTSTLLKFMASLIFTGLYISIFWEHKAAFFKLFN